MAENWNCRRILTWTTEDFERRGLLSPRLDAELLLAQVLGLSRVQLYLDLDRPLTGRERAAFKELVLRRRRAEPMAYILGRREFYGRDFLVTPAVLVPRPDTETLVEAALPHLDEGQARTGLDVGCGSGAVGLTLALERQSLRVDLCDASADALALAKQNAERLGCLPRVSFFQGDLFDAVSGRDPYDLVVSNPPYIPHEELEGLPRDVRDHEPRIALDGGPSGLRFYRRMAETLRTWLLPGGVALFEVGAGQAEEVAALFSAQPGLAHRATHHDLGGIARVVEVHRAREPRTP